MWTETRIFLGICAFLAVDTVVYGWWTWGSSHPHGVEWVGTLALALSAGLCAICGFYFWFVARRIDPRPEDRADAQIAEGAGELGFFSPGSYWPFGIAVSAVTAALGIVIAEVWLLVLGIVAVLVAALGLLTEYYASARRSREPS